MTKEKMTEVTLTTRVKWGGRYWPQGKGDVPTAALDDLRKAGVLDEPAVETPREPEPSANQAVVVLNADEVEAVKIAAADLPADALRSDGKPKVAALNAALKAGGSELVLTGAQIDALEFGEA